MAFSVFIQKNLILILSGFDSYRLQIMIKFPSACLKDICLKVANELLIINLKCSESFMPVL